MYLIIRLKDYWINAVSCNKLKLVHSKGISFSRDGGSQRGYTGFKYSLSVNPCYFNRRDGPSNLATFSISFTQIINVRTQCFSEKFRKKTFFWYSYFFRKDLLREYLVVLKFLLEVPKFKENEIICIITVIKVRHLLLTLLQVIIILAA